MTHLFIQFSHYEQDKNLTQKYYFPFFKEEPGLVWIICPLYIIEAGNQTN